jgi:hypothetical protein
MLVMLETPHVAVGAAIATKVVNPFLAIPLSLASHFVLDRVPHWNPHFYTEMKKYGKPSKRSVNLAMVDSFTALALGVAIAARAMPDTGHAILILICSFMAVLPDQIKTPFFFIPKARKGWLLKYVKFERGLQVDAPFWVGIATQGLTVATAIWWIFS